MKKNYYFLLVVFSLLSSEIYTQDVWEQLKTGPFGGSVQTLAMNTNGDIFAGTGNGGIYISTNNGGNWENIPFNYSVNSIITEGDNFIYVGTGNNGIFLSTDKGITWSNINSNSNNILSINSAGRIFAISFGFLYYSDDKGSNWMEIDGVYNVKAISFNSADEIFVGSSYGIFRSLDNGNSWSPINSGIDSTIDIQALSIDENNHIFAGNSDGEIFRSKDNGENWIKIGDISEEFTNIRSINSNNGFTFIATNKGIFRYNNDDEFIRTILGSFTSSVFGLTGDIFVGSDINGIYKSANNGIDWSEVNNGILNTSVSTLSFNSNDHIIAGCRSGIFLSVDNGNSWSRIDDTSTFSYTYEAIFDDYGNILACWSYYDGLFRTTNLGESWEKVLDQTTVSLAGDKKGNMFAGTWRGVYKSNNGINWESLSDGAMQSWEVQDIVISNNNIFAVVEHGLPAFLIYSKDAGISWNTIFDPNDKGLTNTQIYSLAFDFRDYIFAGTSYGGVYFSTDTGSTWTQINNGFTFKTISALLVDNDGSIYAGTTGDGVFKSADLGYSWQEYNLGLTNKNISTLEFNLEGFMYAGTRGGGIFRSTNPLPVPVELTSLTAKNINNIIHLNWATATETNNKGFDVYRKKLEVRSQETEWELIGFIEGKGTTTENQNYTFIDKNIINGKYSYKLKQIDFDGSFKYSDEVEVEIIPAEYSLSQNYPNPFNPSTTIEYQIKNKEKVMINIYNSVGEIVRILLNEEKESGSYEVVWDGKDNFGKQTASGIYYYKITAGNFLDVKKMILLK